MSSRKPSELQRLIAAFGYSIEGLRTAWGEAAFRTEIIVCIVMFPLALLLGKSNVERALLAGSLLLVLVTELLNTGIEAVVDRISKERHPLSKKAKDVRSTAVLA